MKYLGRYRLGERVPLALQCVTLAGVPTWPDAAPYADVWNAAGTKIKTVRMVVVDRFRVTGLFTRRLFLGAEFAVGSCRVVYRYTTNSAVDVGQDHDYFELIGGGHADGPVISMHAFDRPGALYVVHGTAAGRLLRGRNPS